VDVGVLPLPHPVDEGDLPAEVVRIAAEDQVAIQEDVEKPGSIFGGGLVLSRQAGAGRRGKEAGDQDNPNRIRGEPPPLEMNHPVSFVSLNSVLLSRNRIHQLRSRGNMSVASCHR
jgi:hypothetical protein